MPITIGDVLRDTETQLKQAGIETARLDALVLLEHVTREDRAWLLTHPEYQLNMRSLNLLENLIKKRAKHVPVAYLTGHKEFYGLDFTVTPDVIIPRPETEAIVEFVLSLRKGGAFMQVLDVGTGSGCIAIAIAKHRPKWPVMATDISLAALNIARRNAKKNEVNIKFIQSDLFAKIRGNFDIVTANLPYVKSRTHLAPEARHEPKTALVDGSDGLDSYRRFFEQVPAHLKPNAHVIIEADPWQHPELKKIAKPAGLTLKRSDRFALVFAV
ncbi:peptide chain release factor N(5)-glutamine methyltransferase [Candidatus Microgenomates bacterium]|nr:peptide chain release factor N(5)-glutamine methyltransferase [Candidatus Microgenomates bacterium]